MWVRSESGDKVRVKVWQRVWMMFCLLLQFGVDFSVRLRVRFRFRVIEVGEGVAEGDDLVERFGLWLGLQIALGYGEIMVRVLFRV